MATYTPLKTGQAPTIGTSGDAIKAFQTQLNTTNQGIAGYTPIKVDGLYGPLTQAASLFKAPEVKTTAPTTTTNPVISGTTVRSDVTALGNDITALNSASASNTKLLNDRMAALEARREQEISQIRSDYETANKQQEGRQNQEYSGRSTGLVTSGGGFLGNTQSQQGVLANLKVTHEGEKTALMSKRDAAISAAQSAFDDKQFSLAQSLIKEAKDTEQEIYSRQKDYADQVLAMSRENRAQSEYEGKRIEDKLKAYSTVAANDENIALDPAFAKEIDDYYKVPGFTKQYLEAERSAAQGKTIENDLKFKNSLQTLINKTPYGQRINIGGVNYVGMKKATGSGGTVKGAIPTSLATQLGVPSLAGKKESDVILSLSFKNAPAWYKEFYAASAPEAYAAVANNPAALQADWLNFVSQPDIEAYKNSAVVTKRIEDSNNSLDFSADDIANALNEED